jgi:aminomethyltransferase
MLKTTPFHPRTSALCEAQNWRRWAGTLVAGSYELTHDREYWSIRNSAGLIDVSPLYKYRISGEGAETLLNRVVTRDVRRCQIGQVMYTPWCDGRGKVLDDGTLQRLTEDTFRLTAADPNLRWLHDNATGLNVTIEDESDKIASLSLQGPNAYAILNEITDADLEGLKYFHLTHGAIKKIPATISRTGYTGDLGYEIWVEAKHALKLWDTLIESGEAYGITPVGMLGLDMARIEAGLLMIEVDYLSARQARIEMQASTPLELGLGRAVALNKGEFVGRSALEKEQRDGREWGFVGIEIEWDSFHTLYKEMGLPPQLPAAAWRTSTPIYIMGHQIGYASSGCWSPLLKKYIALAHLREPYAQVGVKVEMEVTVEHQRKTAAAQVVRLPFFEPERKRALIERQTA